MAQWIKLYRKVKDSSIWQNLNSKNRDVMISILLSVNWEEKEWFDGIEWVKIYPGEMITSISSLKRLCASDMTTQNIRTALLTLERGKFLTSTSTNRWRRIKVLNWAKYQGKECELTSTSTSKPTSESTSRLTTTKEYKNIRNKESINTSVAIATDLTKKSEHLVNEMRPLIQEFISQGGKEDICRREANKFVSYWTEPNKSKTRLRYELEKTWDTKRRLLTWFSRVKDYQPAGTRKIINLD